MSDPIPSLRLKLVSSKVGWDPAVVVGLQAE